MECLLSVTCLPLSHQEHLDYEIVQSLNPEFNKAVIRVNVFREHRQTIQVRLISVLICGPGPCCVDLAVVWENPVADFQLNVKTFRSANRNACSRIEKYSLSLD